jgi:hypothetical protein
MTHGGVTAATFEAGGVRRPALFFANKKQKTLTQ